MRGGIIRPENFSKLCLNTPWLRSSLIVAVLYFPPFSAASTVPCEMPCAVASDLKSVTHSLKPDPSLPHGAAAADPIAAPRATVEIMTRSMPDRMNHLRFSRRMLCRAAFYAQPPDRRAGQPG